MDGRLQENWRVAEPASSVYTPPPFNSTHNKSSPTKSEQAQDFSGVEAMQPPLQVAEGHILSQSQSQSQYQDHPQYSGQVSPMLMPPATPSMGSIGDTSYTFGKAYNKQQAIGNPDDLIRQIPEMDFAVADFNSVTMNAPPFRDIPSVLIAHLNRPNVADAEPGWELLLRYFLGSQAHHGHGNLQDLYIFITRVALPNIIITNRRLLLAMYLARGDLPPECRLRYDSICAMGAPTLPTTTTAPSNLPTTPTRPIFRSRPTPNGADFLAWLQMPPSMQNDAPAPPQMAHRESGLDAYLIDDETAVRGLQAPVLLARTAEALRVWWWIVGATRRLEGFERVGWRWVEGECEGGMREEGGYTWWL
ncbi:hypothetical protein K505DRAFT_376402 [Melanomma pulvis-pyrius CBS 109.77]|uniref:Uncharacterized protein n=1 Tax=Melanomma pulvis-pyrius CBS 109.77 TaxID=1314802 RepID=A0A6A6X606_9PLEO|nr:hypothetical protein K505DRAFT_376402 [Melanomma pulvis-pyrius CBS 109.77]